jgi:hypothetical protein
MAGYSREDWACRRKRRYDTVEDAHKVAESMNRDPKHIGVAGTYRCEYCGQWHVGRDRKTRYSSG